MARFRWIDARKGILEYTREDVPAAVEGVYIIDFTEKTVKGAFAAHDAYLSMWSRSRSTLRLTFRDADLCALRTEETDEWPETFVHHEDQAKMMEHYQSWLSRVMLAEDIHKSRAEERKGSPQAVHSASNDKESDVHSTARPSGLHSSGNDCDGGRVPLRKNAQEIPVVRGELAWRIRPK